MKTTNNSPNWFKYPQFEWQNKQATIIGGGIAGCQVAWHLCEQGWQVTIIERHHKLATEASGNPAGVISPKMTAEQSIGEDFYLQSFQYTLSLLDKLRQQGHAIEMDQCGVLQLSHNDRELKRWHSLKKRSFSSDIIQLLNEIDTEDVAGLKLHPDKNYKSCYFPKGGWINPASFCKALTSHENCKVIYHSEAITLEKNDQQWQVLDSAGEVIDQSEVIIIASGKDLFSLKQSEHLPGVSVAGQTTFAVASEFSSKLKTVIGHEGYLTPAIQTTAGNHHTFGATFQRDISNPVITAEADSDNYEKLKHYLPEFGNSITETQSAHIAVRMTTPDRFPYVGALPDLDFFQLNYNDLHQGKQWKTYPEAEYQNGLFVMGGFGSRGITTSGLCAKTLAGLITNVHPYTPSSNKQLLDNCHPARFIIKNLKRNKPFNNS